MEKEIPDYLKLHVEPSLEPSVAPQADDAFPLESLCGAFERATGWQLVHSSSVIDDRTAAWSAPIHAGSAQQLAGSLALRLPTPGAQPADTRASLEDVRALAAATARLLGELWHVRHTLRHREAELAAGVPVVPHRREDVHLAERLEAVLRGGAEAIRCQAAALYLLDDATTQLKLRACWGLPQDRLLDSPRPLRGALADLEALVGHAVALEDTALLPHWRVPEDFPAAICVPVSTPTTPLGTLWLFSSQPRDFSSEQTQLVEIVAGRLAADLEREMLLRQGVESKQLERQLRQALRWQQLRLPGIAPLLDDWQLAGWTSTSDSICGSFYDWSILPDSSLAICVGDVHRDTLEAALAAAALQTSVRSHEAYRHSPLELVGRVNETVWSASPGDGPASVFYGVIQPGSGELELCVAGEAHTYLVRDGRVQPLTSSGTPLGMLLESEFEASRCCLQPQDLLVAMTPGRRAAFAGVAAPEPCESILEIVRHHAGASAKELAELVRDAALDSKELDHGGSLLIVKHLPK